MILKCGLNLIHFYLNSLRTSITVAIIKPTIAAIEEDIPSVTFQVRLK